MKRRLFYYFYALVMRDPENAARYLASLALPAHNSDVDGFQAAVAGLYGRWLRSPNFKDFSLAQVILQSILLAGQYRIQYPGEIILMVKALVTVEASPTCSCRASILSRCPEVTSSGCCRAIQPLTIFKASLQWYPSWLTF
jgi:predicted unusual protein kinase regulating ubiquinone biosynthesis (AarF/ABC1/UbiB family)